MFLESGTPTSMNTTKTMQLRVVRCADADVIELWVAADAAWSAILVAEREHGTEAEQLLACEPVS